MTDTSMIETPASESQHEGTTPEPGNPEPFSPNLHAIVCAACGKIEQHVTVEQVRAFLDEHEACRAATVEFDVSMPSAMAEDGVRQMVHEVWARQAMTAGYRPFGQSDILYADDQATTIVVRGNAVPANHRHWNDMENRWQSEIDAEDAEAERAKADNDNGPVDLPEGIEHVTWPPGGDPE